MENIKYRIDYLEDVVEKLNKLPKTVRSRIVKAIDERLSYLPEEMGKELVREWKRHRRLRVGDYRVIYRVFKKKVVVLIVEIDHRKIVYDL